MTLAQCSNILKAAGAKVQVNLKFSKAIIKTKIALSPISINLNAYYKNGPF